MELIDSVQLFTGSDKLDRLVYYGTDGKGGTAAGITVQLGQYHAVEVQTFVEFFGCVYGILSGHGVYHKQDFVRVNGGFDCSDLVHHFLVYGQTTGCIDDYEVIPFCFGFLYGVLGYGYRVFAVRFGVHGHFDLFCQYAQLFDSGGTVNVTGYQ